MAKSFFRNFKCSKGLGEKFLGIIKKTMPEANSTGVEIIGIAVDQ